MSNPTKREIDFSVNCRNCSNEYLFQCVHCKYFERKMRWLSNEKYRSNNPTERKLEDEALNAEKIARKEYWTRGEH